MTSYPVSRARNAIQFVEVAVIGAGPADQVLPRMLASFGQSETDRIVSNLKQVTGSRSIPGTRQRSSARSAT